MADDMVTEYRAWRELFRVHPAAERVPLASRGESDAIKSDIEHSGLKVPIEFLVDGDSTDPVNWAVLDGRTRLDCLHELGFRFAFGARGPLMQSANGKAVKLNYNMEYAHKLIGTPLENVISFNVMRRHLNREQKAAMTSLLLKETPENSDREIARLMGISPTTVGTVRARLEALGELLHQDMTLGADQKWRTTERRTPERKTPERKTPAAEPAPEPARKPAAAPLRRPMDGASGQPAAEPAAGGRDWYSGRARLGTADSAAASAAPFGYDLSDDEVIASLDAFIKAHAHYGKDQLIEFFMHGAAQVAPNSKYGRMVVKHEMDNLRRIAFTKTYERLKSTNLKELMEKLMPLFASLDRMIKENHPVHWTPASLRVTMNEIRLVFAAAADGWPQDDLGTAKPRRSQRQTAPKGERHWDEEPG
jgi:hypothetical protein